MMVNEIKLPREKKKQLEIINGITNNILYFRPRGFPTESYVKYTNVRVEEDFVDIPTGSRETMLRMRTRKEYGFYLQNGDFKRWIDPVFLKLEEIII